MAATSMDFQPSPSQRRLLDFIHEHPSLKTIHELCAEAGVGRSTYYRWCQNPGFRLWLAMAWSARLLLDGAVLLNIARVQSTRSYSYWKALFDLTFDPKGLGFLQKWQQSCAEADSAAFLPGDASPETPSPVPLLATENKPLVPKSGTNPPAAVLPKPNRGGRAALPAGKIGAKGREPGPPGPASGSGVVVPGPPGSAAGPGVVVIPKGGPPPGSEFGAAPARRSAGLGPRGPQAGVSTSGTRGAAAPGPAPTIALPPPHHVARTVARFARRAQAGRCRIAGGAS